MLRVACSKVETIRVTLRAGAVKFFQPAPPPILLAQEVSGKIEFEYFFLSEEAGQTAFKLGWVGRHPVSV